MQEMTLNEKGKYELTVGVNGPFNIHLEKDFVSPVQISVKTAGDKFKDAYVFDGVAFVIDSDIVVGYMPKLVKIECLAAATEGATVPKVWITDDEGNEVMAVDGEGFALMEGEGQEVADVPSEESDDLRNDWL